MNEKKPSAAKPVDKANKAAEAQKAKVQEQQKPVQQQQQQKGQEAAEEGANKKNRKKKLNKKRRKQKQRKAAEENQVLLDNGYDPETLDPEERELILQQLQDLEDEQEDGQGDNKEDDEQEKAQSAAKVEPPKLNLAAAEPEEKGKDAQADRGPLLDENFRIKIVDLGNGCWIHHHFTSKIQTRQYRSPEVILGLHYDTSADIWSFACTIFEMLTGDFLFEPRKGQNFGKNDDHLAQVIELLKPLPKKYIKGAKNYKKFFDKAGNLRRIQGFHYWPLKNVLTDKYQMKDAEAEAFSKFMLPMLDYYPLKRASAQKALRDPWFKMPKDYNFKMSEEEHEALLEKRQMPQENSFELEHEPYLETEDNEGEDEGYDPDIDEDGENNNFEWLDEEHDYYGYKHLMNKSYDNGVYTGYADGILVDQLDQEANFQFKKFK